MFYLFISSAFFQISKIQRKKKMGKKMRGESKKENILGKKKSDIRPKLKI